VASAWLRWGRVVRMLQASGYRGYLSLEYGQ
jgi:hypothetical protein